MPHHDCMVNFARPYLDKTLTLSESNVKAWRQWWCGGRISTFKYLMCLHFASGCFYSDLRQYPIFPHSIADYISQTLDLTSAGTFRNLEKPMGAQTHEERAAARDGRIDGERRHHPHGRITLLRSRALLHMNNKTQRRCFSPWKTANTIYSAGTGAKELKLHGLPSHGRITMPFTFHASSDLWCLPELQRRDRKFSKQTKQKFHLVRSLCTVSFGHEQFRISKTKQTQKQTFV